MSNSHHTNPWLGLTSYEFEDSYKFFGRSVESGQLSDAIKNNTVTVIYGPSGSGKTSIIKAGIFPKLIQEYYFPVYIRLQHNSNINYSGQILKAIEDAALSKNIDIENVCDFDEIVNEKDSLWVYLHTHNFWSTDNYPFIPLLVIDQFEEIFTLNQNIAKISDFFNLVDDLYDHLPPPDVQSIVESSESYIPFLTDVKYKLILSLREDFLARLEDYSRDIPILRKNRFGLKAMNGQQAYEVITNPVPGLVDDHVAIKIIQKVSGYHHEIIKEKLSDISVETSILSLFCSELYKRMNDASMQVISGDLVDTSGDNIIEDYYISSVNSVSRRTVLYLEDNLLTKSGFRNTIALEDAIDHGVDKRDIGELQNKRLIRIEIINGTERIEYTHDILCRVAKERRNKRRHVKDTGVRKRIRKKYIFDGVVCYSIFILTFWMMLREGDRLGKATLLATIPILLAHFIRLPIILKERKAVLLRFIVLILNITAFPFIADIFPDGDSDNIVGLVFLGIYVTVLSLYFIAFPALTTLSALFRVNEFDNRMSWKDFFTLQLYKKHPDLIRVESDILLPLSILGTILIVAISARSMLYLLIALILIYLAVHLKKWIKSRADDETV